MENNNTITHRLDQILKHQKNVRENCYQLGHRLMCDNEIELGLKLVTNGQIHGNSKLRYSIEFNHLWDPNDLEFINAKNHHHGLNPHHPEYWPEGIKSMSDEFIAEMVCDWVARCNEFGTYIQNFIESSLSRFNYTKNDEVYSKILKYTEILTHEGVHRTHCCFEHGCKYGEENCPVVLGYIKQDYPCESCGDERW